MTEHLPAIRKFAPIVVLVALSIVAALVARDAAAVHRTIKQDDLVFVQGQPVYDRLWRLETTLPYVPDLFGIGDDLIYRHALRKYAAEDRRQRGRLNAFNPGLRAEAQAALSIAERSGLSAARRSKLASLRGSRATTRPSRTRSTLRPWRRRRSSTSTAP